MFWMIVLIVDYWTVENKGACMEKIHERNTDGERHVDKGETNTKEKKIEMYQ